MIVGVSFDDPSLNQAWAEEEGFNFDLWTDADRTLAVYYGAASSASTRYASRVTRLLDAEGVLLVNYDSVSATNNPGEVLEDCQQIYGN